MPEAQRLLDEFAKASAEFLRSPAMRALSKGIVDGGIMFVTTLSAHIAEQRRLIDEARAAKPGPLAG